VRFQVLTAASVRFRVLWVVAPCSHDEVDDVSDVRIATIIREIIALMMKAVYTTE
jgi:hypothetical protein